jgi:hypothetical protein
MCARCSRDGGFVVSSLIFVLGRLFITPLPPAAREALITFAGEPRDDHLQTLLDELIEHQLFAQLHGIVRDVELFGGLQAVLAAADDRHIRDFQSAMAAIKGGNDVDPA